MSSKRRKSDNSSGVEDSGQPTCVNLKSQVKAVMVSAERVNFIQPPTSPTHIKKLKRKLPTSNKPISAIAARKAAAAAAAAAARQADTSTEEVTEDATLIEQSAEEELMEATDTTPEPSTPVDTPAPNTSTDEGTYSRAPPRPKARERPIRKREPKFRFTDENSVSRFTPSDANIKEVNVNEEPCLLIGLQSDESIVFAGKALIAPVSGAVSIMGSILRPFSSDTIDLYPVFSPKTHALLTIAPADEDNAIVRKSSTQITTDKSIKEAIQDIASQGFKSVFLVMGMQWCGLDDIEDLPDVPRQMFELRPDNRYPQGAVLSSILGFHPVLSVVPDVKAFEIPATWESSVRNAANDEKVRKSPLVGVICGSKDMGKSTLARYLVNELLNKHKQVAFLETDVGQGEFTPSGMISLHLLESPVMGPPYTHQNLTPMHSHFIGALTSASNPRYYLDTIGHLIRLYRERYDNRIDACNADLVPLVINTQGWIGGLGYDLLTSVIQQASPTDVFVMHSQNVDASRNLPPSFDADITPSPGQGRAPSVHYIQSVFTPSFVRLDAYSSRTLTSVSYFHQDLHNFGAIGKRWWSFQARIVDRLPWVLDWRKGLQDGIWFLFDDVPKSQILYALNGTMVALIGSTDGAAQESDVEESSEDEISPPLYFPPSENPPPMPAATACYGLAIIRAIDPSNHAFHIITPLPSAQLKKVSAIVKGNLALPIAALLDRHNGNGNGIARQPWSKVPYVESSVNVNGIGASARKSRRVNIRKRGP